MSSQSAFVPSTPEDVESWLERSFTLFDSLDITKLEDFFAADAELQYANNPVAKGIDAIRASFAGSYSVISYMKHITIASNKADNKIWWTARIAYRVKGDPENEELTIPASAVATVRTEGTEAGKASRMEVYLDNRPIVEKIEAVAKLQRTSQ